MRRALVLFFTLLLPLQFAWGALTAYCQHESGAARNHLGHHEHVHKADRGDKAAAGTVQDNDCGTCHAAGLPALTADLAPVRATAPPQAQFQAADESPGTAPRTQPERPKWARPAA